MPNIKNSRHCSTCKYYKKERAQGSGFPRGICKLDGVEVTPLYVDCDDWKRPRTLANRDTKKCGTCMHFIATEPECAFHVACTYRTTSCCEYQRKANLKASPKDRKSIAR